ncbi:MAG: isopentenyl-diphosphate Delta-isomerase [Chitinophagaceae bacterium]|nr:MAG: isopentenyl-diphosphate Delta-isomerase [Chitinophagaceae bacterium]
MTEEAQVVLVNEQDEPQGTMGKLEAHRRGLLHRAISIFLFDKNGRMLLQQRAAGKYHGGGLWSNACCSHPLPGEAPADAAARRLREELGISLPLEPVFSFTYRAEVENGLVEHEYDHVFAGTFEGSFALNPEEVADVRYISTEDLEAELRRSPEQFTQWFRMIYGKVNRIWEEKRF